MAVLAHEPESRGAPRVAGEAGPIEMSSRLSLRLIVSGVAMLLVSGAVIGMGIIGENRVRESLGTQMQARLLLQARNLALSSSDALLRDYPEIMLHPLTKSMLQRQPELAAASVVDHSGILQGHPDARMLGEVEALPADLQPVTSDIRLENGERLAANSEDFVAVVPVRNLSGAEIGHARVTMHQSVLHELIEDSRRQTLTWLVLFALIGAAGAFVAMSALLRPLKALREGLSRVGRGNLDEPIRLRDRTELGLLAETINDMSSALKNAQEVRLDQARLSHEVGLARTIQQSLLPARPTTSGDFTIRGHQLVAEEVGGDYYEVLPLEDGRLALAVADVSGKGLAGCMVMTMVSSLLRAFRSTHQSPSAMLTALDQELSSTLQPAVFVTMFYGILDPADGSLVFASAGHNPMIVYRAASATTEVLHSRGIPLAALRTGIIRDTLDDFTIRLNPGDLLVEYTDGFSEAPSEKDGEQLGLARLRTIVQATGQFGVDATLNAFNAAVRGWSGPGVPYDDETLLVVGRAAMAQATPAALGEPERESVWTAFDDQDAIRFLEESEQRGFALHLPARVDAIGEVMHWIGETHGLQGLRARDAKVLGTALYEACSNIAEHGYGEAPERKFSLYWLPPHPDQPNESASPLHDGASATRGTHDSIDQGLFVICDDGRPFKPTQWTASDFSSQEVRARRRGFGLDIIYRAMRIVSYHPGTVRGNITLLAFRPQSHPEPEGIHR